MDRNDAAFVANVLECRIAGAREDLERHAASSFAVLLAASAIIRDQADGWAPALAAAAELSAIAKGAGSVCDQPPAAELAAFVECMKKLADEKPLLNRAGRRKLIAAQPRDRRLVLTARQLRQVGRTPNVIH